eukprot:jgi/Mesvir1/27397/Mv07199-RA.1
MPHDVCPHARGALVGARRKCQSGVADHAKMAMGPPKAPMRGSVLLISCRRQVSTLHWQLLLFLPLIMSIRVVSGHIAAHLIETASSTHETATSEEECLQYDNGGDVAAKGLYSDTFWTPGAENVELAAGHTRTIASASPTSSPSTSPRTTQHAQGNLMGHGVNHDASLESKALAESEVMVDMTTTHRQLLAHDLASDTLALLAVKNAISNDSAMIFESWTVDGDPCAFAWVSCNGGRVTHLYLPFLFLSGTIARELGSLTALTNLYLSYNSLSGVIPRELGSLSSLQTLELSYNSLSGVIPPELGSLASLQNLELSYNSLSGVIPPELGSLASLQNLHLSDNSLRGIPPELGSLTSLRYLYLYNNSLSGVIPPELGSLTSLWYLSYNSLSGVIPPELGSLTSLWSLYLSYNSLSGVIPPELGSLSSLQYLALDNNQLYGVIPSELASVASLRTLYLYSNMLSGTIPSDLASLTSMETMDVSSNNLVGTIPPELQESLSFLYYYLDIIPYLNVSYNPWICGPSPSHGEAIVNRTGTWGLTCPVCFDTAYSSAVDWGCTLECPACMNFTACADCHLHPLPPPPSISSDARALLAVKSAISNPGTIFHSWTVDGDPCAFAHVSCNGGRVTGLDLDYLYLSGTVARELGSLTALTKLELSYNSLSGVIPRELGSLASLQNLDLYHNRLSGVIPRELGSLSSLQYLDLSLSRLSGFIPRFLGSLAFLRSLDLSDNSLSGGIPRELGWLASLQELDLSDNSLGGGIPRELGSLSSLQHLALYSNSLSGGIPPELGSLSSLRTLELSYNSLSGVIPPELGSLALLPSLVLSDIRLSGVIPPELGSLSSLWYLYLSDSSLSGVIPPELGSLSSLQYLVLSGNRLSGGIPPELGSLSSLWYLYLSDSSLSGVIPPELGSLSSLWRLVLSNNRLSGVIPRELGWLASLQELWVYSTSLSGVIPPELGSLASLRYLVLHSNRLSGVIPPELGSLSSLWYLYTSYNRMSGVIPPELGSLSSLWRLSFHYNSLSGVIPLELGSLSSLQHLFLSDNKLSGIIPRKLGSLVALQYLDLYNNSLSGVIPPELGSLASLQYLDLHWNRLSGFIPPQLGSLASLNEMILFVNKLSGTIPPELGSLDSLYSMSLRSNNLEGTIPAELGSLASLQGLDFSSNNLVGTIPPELRSKYLGDIYQAYMTVSYNPWICGPSPSGRGWFVDRTGTWGLTCPVCFDTAYSPSVDWGCTLDSPECMNFTACAAPPPPPSPAACGDDVGYDLSYDLISVINDDPACDFPNYFHDEATGCPSSSCGVGPLDRPCCPCLQKVMQVLLTSRVSSGMLGLQAVTECRLSTIGECPVQNYVNAMKACSGLNVTSSPNLTSGVAALEAIIAGGFLNPRTLAYSERGFGGIPAAPALAVGPNHLMTVVRSSFGRAFYRVYIKQPWLQVKQSFLTQFHRSNTICRTGPFVGAPSTLYDHLADRWLIMELARNATTGGYFLCLIMSLTGIPYGLLYRGHTIALPGNPGEITVAVMRDAYYFGTTENPPVVYALDRARLITGGTLRPMVRLQAPALAGLTLQGLMPGHVAGSPRAGSSCGLFARPVDDELHSQSPDHAADFVEVWELCPGFDNATAAQLTQLANVRISEFNATLCGSSADSACFAQPGSATRLTTYQNSILSRVVYRSFTDRDSLLATSTVNGGNDRGAIMWVELQRTINASGALGPWERVQDGVTPSDNKNRWHGSAAMDQSGDIVLSYSVVDASNSTYPSLYYTGRGRFAPYGTTPSPETLLVAGTSASATSSFGGRSAMAVDPVDGCKFYFLGPWETQASRSATYLGAVNFTRCTDSAECLLNTDCNDGQFCTLDKCRDGKCVSEPDILLCRFGEICDEEADVCKVP